MRTIFSAIIYDTYKDTEDPQEGYDWLEKLDANTKEYSANPEIMYNQVAKGVGNVSVWNMPDTVQLAEEKEYPFGYHISERCTPIINDGNDDIYDTTNSQDSDTSYEFTYPTE